MSNNNPFALVVLANLYLHKTKNDSEKRYEFKTKLYELAKNRNYSIDDFTKLLIFVTELVKLPLLLEQKFEKEVIQSKLKNSSDMVQVSQTTKNLVNAFAKDVYGESIEELKAKAKADAISKTEDTKIRLRIEKELKEMDEKLTASIILLFTRVHMPIEEIAENLKVSRAVVEQILIQNKAIK